MTLALPLPASNLPSGSSEWWLHRLNRELDERQLALHGYEQYYRGDHPLAFASRKFRDAFGGLLDSFSDNFCSLVVDATRERLNVEGFRLGQNQEGDRDAWRLWQANDLDAESQIAHTVALVKTRCPVLVAPDPDSDLPRISVEDPEQTVVAYRPGNRRARTAALKRWMDDDGYRLATLYLPDRIEKYRSASAYRGIVTQTAWVARDDDGPAVEPNPLGVVPMLELVNRPLLGGDGESELEAVIPIQNAINKLAADMLVASEFGAFRQRWVTGIDIPTDPQTGQPVEPFKSAVDRLWAIKSKDARFGEFEQTDLRIFGEVIELFTQHIAFITRTPAHYISKGNGNPPSGESLKSAETGLVAKVRDKMRFFGETWEGVIRLAFALQGDPRAAIFDSETIWRDPESRSESEHADAIIKLKALNLPDEFLWEKFGFTQTEIARLRAMGVTRSLLDGAVNAGAERTA